MEKYGLLGEGSFCIDAEASADTLLNDATEWLQYARGMTEVMVECLEEAEIPDRRRLMLALGAVGTLIDMGVQCTAQAHAKMQWDKV